MNQIKVLELFAGVGGFRLGLENANKDFYITKWANQWEPSRKAQEAFEIYDLHYPNSENYNKDIAEISNEEFKHMDANLIVGGFPCQDYSVARSKKNEKGIEGKKGVLFWEIIRATKQIEPSYLILENVDRLLKAPSKQRGRDFGIMLSAFNELGYSVEWRVINAAEYGMPQRRRRVFIFVYKNDSLYAKKIDGLIGEEVNENKICELSEYIFEKGLFANAFPVEKLAVKSRQQTGKLESDLLKISETFSGKFWNSGIMRKGFFISIDTKSKYKGKSIKLKDLLQDDKDIHEKYYIRDEEKIKKFQYLRGTKKLERISSTGHKYMYSEGGMSPYEDLELPGRTMLTSEGTINRSTHFIKREGRYRILTPVEAERLQCFPDNWTLYKKTENWDIQEVSDRSRMFFMGNALVTDIIKVIGETLYNEIGAR